jgi:hypothetical protein
MKRELKTRPIHECRCDERLKSKVEESTRLANTGLFVCLLHSFLLFFFSRIKKGRRTKGRKNVTLKLLGVGKASTTCK